MSQNDNQRKTGVAQHATVQEEARMAEEIGADVTGYLLCRVGDACHDEIAQLVEMGADLTHCGVARVAGATHQEVLAVATSSTLGEYACVRKAGADHQSALALLAATEGFEFRPELFEL